MIERRYFEIVTQKLANFSAVGILGPRQIGKTTLALAIAQHRSSIYLDLENYQDLAKLSDPLSYLLSHADKLIILDEIQRKPDLFMTLRSIIDKNRREGKKFGQFLILGSASLDLLRQSSESLAGRIDYVEINPLTVLETYGNSNNFNKLWLRGGFPDSFISASDNASLSWRLAFIKTYLERDIPQFGPRIPSTTLYRMWTMLAHLHGSTLNASKISASLDISGQTVKRYIDLLADLFLVNKLLPFSSNLGKRMVKSPKIYVRDSGILHALLNISNFEALLSHPNLGASWEGFVIDNLTSFLPTGSEYFYYRTARGAEIDLIIKLPSNKLYAIEIKKSIAPKIGRGFYEACEDINPTHMYVIYDGQEKYQLKKGVFAISLNDLMSELLEA